MFLLFLFLFLIHHSTIDSTSISSLPSIDLFLGRCTSSDLQAFLLENELNRVCSVAAIISIRPTTKREWRIVVKITELMMTNRLSLYFGSNLALRFLNKGKVERTLEGKTRVIDVDETAQTSTGPEIYNFSLTYSKDLFEIIAVDANLTYNLRGNETVQIRKFWDKLKLFNIHNASDINNAIASTETQESSGLSTGAIVGITIGALVAFALLCLAARYYFNRRNRLDVTVTHFERADTEKKGMTPPSTPAGGGYIPNKMSRAQNEITGTEITGFTSTASNTGSNASNATNGTNGPGRTGFEGQNILGKGHVSSLSLFIYHLVSRSKQSSEMISLLLVSSLPVATLIALGCGGKKKEPPTGGAAPASGAAPPGAPPAGGAAPAGGEKTGGENKTALDGMSQTGATGGTQA
ncbi:hypothetical protein PRIPAC_70579 [Pristionchus pacificus]|uniref:Uncharacterized protein n=1 Tax=Pristionchus pacificus TaxID=54126 RepID=A0A2A6CA91_PRIPA|nr:hypothetical protein PRIPAC_70579 [Pristionchus pacificus]|eukprot:PDM75094.1 hypothetical protein PRIPAC_40475 [Pristionchus pacificus]